MSYSLFFLRLHMYVRAHMFLYKGRLVAGLAHCSAPSWSLKSRGKSRADLWAFGSLLAIEVGIERHNYACKGDRKAPYKGPLQCVQFEGEPGECMQECGCMSACMGECMPMGE